MPADVQAEWTQLSTGPNPQTAIATWWAQARSALFSPGLLSVALANAARQLPAVPPPPSTPPAPGATGSFVVCAGVVHVYWYVPRAPRAPGANPALVVAVSVSDTVTLPALSLGAAPPASAGIANFPSEFSITGYAGTPIDTSTTRNGLSVHLISTPVSYVWDFGDGTGTTTSSLGVGANPPVTHAFAQSSAKNERAVAGKYQVKVTIVFDTKFEAVGPGTTPGLQDFSDYGLAPLVDAATLPYEVDQLYGVLVPSSPGR